MVTKWCLLATMFPSGDSPPMSNEVNTQHVIEMVSDTICPWCYVGLTRLENALSELPESYGEFVIQHLPFQLNPDMPIEGLNRRDYRSRKFGSWEKSLQLDAQVTKAGREDGLSFNHEAIERTPNTLASHVLIHLAVEEGVQEEVVEAVLRGYFTEGQDIGSPQVLGDIGRAAGMTHEDLAASLQDPTIRSQVASAALLHSPNGVPSFRLNGAPLLSGAQPTAVMVAALKQELGDHSSKEAE